MKLQIQMKGVLNIFIVLLIFAILFVGLGFFSGYRYGLSKLAPVSSGPVVSRVNQTAFPTEATEAAYVERDSPLDQRIENTGAVIFHGPRDKPKIALTFDAEMTDKMKKAVETKQVASSYNSKIIDVLNQTQTKATIFLTGQWIELYPDVTKTLAKNPLLEFGSHSYNDSSYEGFCYGLKRLPNTLRIEEIGSAEKLIREYVGIDNKFFRFPGGCYSEDDVKLVNQANDTVVHWDVKGSDGFNENTNLIISNVVDNVQNGSIIILHLNGAPTSPKTADALPAIISRLKQKGFEFVKVSELLGVSPPTKVSN